MGRHRIPSDVRGGGRGLAGSYPPLYDHRVLRQEAASPQEREQAPSPTQVGLCVCVCVYLNPPSPSKVGQSDSIWLGPQLQRIGFRGLAGMITIGVSSWVMSAVCVSPQK